MKIEWVPQMSVGEENIDNQHKKLFKQVSQMIDKLDSNQEVSIVRDLLRFLGDYVEEHFAYEEEYMKKHKFPGLEDHKKLHHGFVKFFEEYKREFNEKTESTQRLSENLKELAEKAKKFLGEWLINHTLTVDQEYKKYIVEHSK